MLARSTGCHFVNQQCRPTMQDVKDADSHHIKSKEIKDIHYYVTIISQISSTKM